ncbi:hypothetical protein HYW73_01970 [Candidatus Nomurabacteria bacterium]|nr:hypothetical protein [Candidatus Nomurabacteria bacterium]
MKIIFAVAAALVTIIGYFPYFKDLFAKKTTPHIYSWLIWLITQGTAVAALIYGGGGLGGVGLIVGLFLVFAIVLFSFKYGTKNITTSDTVLLALALLAIVVWWQLDNPLLSVVMVSFIDGLAYVPTFRKTYHDPYSETTSFWIFMALSDVLAMLANTEYNFLTMTYLSTLAIANIILLITIVVRRKTVV